MASLGRWWRGLCHTWSLGAGAALSPRKGPFPHASNQPVVSFGLAGSHPPGGLTLSLAQSSHCSP